MKRCWNRGTTVGLYRIRNLKKNIYLFKLKIGVYPVIITFINTIIISEAKDKLTEIEAKSKVHSAARNKLYSGASGTTVAEATHEVKRMIKLRTAAGKIEDEAGKTENCCDVSGEAALSFGAVSWPY